jgi:hypothetical protein
LTITKGGNGEGLIVNKTGGSGNAVTVTGTLNATTLVKSGGTSSQFLKADGTVDNSTYLTTTGSGSGLSGVVLTSTNQIGITGDKSWEGTQTITNNVNISYGTSGLPALQATTTNTGGRALGVLANSTLEPLSVTQQGSGPLAQFNLNATDQVILRNNGSIYTRGQLEVGTLLVGDAGDSSMVHRYIDNTVRRVPNTGTGSAVFSASPTFTGTLNGAAATLTGALSGTSATFSSTLQTGGNIRTLMAGSTDVPSIYAENNVGSLAQIRVFGTSAAGTLFGITRAGWSSIDTNNGVGLLFGTTDNSPIIIGTNNAEGMRITSGGNVGIGTISPTEKLEVNGSIKTASPSGGTAKPFKIGNVATVTPTLQNRTIEIEIDGTTYYLTAKTTNN